MNILIIGDWHLAHITTGTVLSLGHKVTLLTKKEIKKKLEQNELIVDEPGLDELFKKGFATNNLRVEYEIKKLKNDFEFIWISNDTNLEFSATEVMEEISNLIKTLLKKFSSDKDLVISSQIPLGTCDFLKNKFQDNIKNLFIVPENLQLGKGIDSFIKQDRFIVGLSEVIQKEKRPIIKFLKSINNNIIYMNHNSAELLKHSLNSYLAMNISFANEIGKLAKAYNASSKDISIGLKSDKRVGDKAYVLAGNAFHGGTLKRDLNHLENLSKQKNINLPLIKSILISNELHANLVIEILKNYENINNVFTSGLTYKINSNVLRDSNFMKDIYTLLKMEKKVYCFDSDIRLSDPKVIDIKNKGALIFKKLNDFNANNLVDCFIINKIKDSELSDIIKLIRRNFRKEKKVLLIDLNSMLVKYFSNLDYDYIKLEVI